MAAAVPTAEERAFYQELGKRLSTHEYDAKRCWEAWQISKASDFAIPEKNVSAFRNRLNHFQAETGLGTQVAAARCRVLAIVEQELAGSSDQAAAS